MATIIQQPSEDIVTINEPVTYIFQEILSGITTNPSAIEVVLQLDGVDLDTLYLDAFQVTRTSDTYCVFKMNAAEMLRKHITQQRDLFFALRGTQYSAYDLQKYRLKVTAYLPDVDGILQRDSTPVYTAYKKVSNIYLKENESISDLSTYLSTSSNRQLLTTSKRIQIRRDEYRALSFIKVIQDTDLTVKFYSGNTQIGRGIVGDVDNIAGDDRLLLINASVDSVALYDFSSSFTIGDINIAHADRYKISLSSSESIEFIIVDDCPGYRLHFLNRFGFFDSVTLFAEISNAIKTKSSSFERNKTAVNVHSETTLQKVGQKTFVGYATNLSPSDAAWLEELMMSPLVFMEENGQFLPVIIEDDTTKTRETAELISYQIKFSLSNKRRSQRN